MSQIKGVVSKLFSKEAIGKYGKQYQVGITVDDVRYGAFLKDDPSKLGLAEGKLVTFTFTEKGEYKNFDPKSLVVSKEAPVAVPAATTAAKPAAAAATKTAWAGEKGVKIGHAINNAVLLAIAEGKRDSKTVTKYAIGILMLNRTLEASYEAILDGTSSLLSPEATTPAATPTKGKPGRKPAAKVVPPPPPPPPEPEPEEAEPDAAETEPGEPQYDEDIPF